MNLESLLNGMNLTLAGAIWGVVHTVKTLVPAVSEHKVGYRLIPLLPLVLGAVGGAAGAVTVDPVTMANKIVAGVMVGGLSMVVFKLGAQTVLGKGYEAAEPTEKPEAAKGE
jgi:hypothetical protein